MEMIHMAGPFPSLDGVRIIMGTHEGGDGSESALTLHCCREYIIHQRGKYTCNYCYITFERSKLSISEQ